MARIFAVSILVFLATTPATAVPAVVDAPWLAAHAEAVTAIEIVTPDRRRPDRHVPGAVVSSYAEDGWYVDYEGLPHMLPPPDDLAASLGRLGLSEDAHVVVVPVHADPLGYAVAARAFWALRMLGHARLSLLDGGLPAYVSAGFPLTDTPRRPIPRPYRAAPGEDHLASSDQVRMGEAYGASPIDVRAVPRHRGETGHPAVAFGREGTIEGAVNIPPHLFLEDGRLKSRAAYANLFDGVLGASSHATAVLFSDTGLHAALGWFCIHAVLGRARVRLYDGGFVLWQAEGREVFNDADDMGGVIG